MSDIKTRYRYGKPDAEGRTPVYVDGATEPAGYVWKMGRSASPWWARGARDPKRCGTHHTRQYLAAERLVDMVDNRAAVAAEIERRRARRTQAPAGWRWASWDEIEREGYPMIRPVYKAPYVYGDSGERYPDTVADRPVTLLRIARLDSGSVVVSGTERGKHRNLPEPLSLLLSPDTADLGALVPERQACYIAPAQCPACEQDGPLYQTGTRLGCATCTAADLGCTPADLPAPVDDEGTVWWTVGDTARRTFDLPEDGGHAETGRVIETVTDVTSRTRRVRCDYGGRWPIESDAAALAPTA